MGDAQPTKVLDSRAEAGLQCALVTIHSSIGRRCGQKLGKVSGKFPAVGAAGVPWEGVLQRMNGGMRVSHPTVDTGISGGDCNRSGASTLATLVASSASCQMSTRA
jgi:hypothetical protein